MVETLFEEMKRYVHWGAEDEQALRALRDRAAPFFREIGIDVADLRRRRRPLARPCMDWTERRPHLAGSLGMHLGDRFLANAWVVRHPRDRSLRLTERGRRAVTRVFGLDAASVPGGSG